MLFDEEVWPPRLNDDHCCRTSSLDLVSLLVREIGAKFSALCLLRRNGLLGARIGAIAAVGGVIANGKATTVGIGTMVDETGQLRLFGANATLGALLAILVTVANRARNLILAVWVLAGEGKIAKEALEGGNNQSNGRILASKATVDVGIGLIGAMARAEVLGTRFADRSAKLLAIHIDGLIGGLNLAEIARLIVLSTHRGAIQEDIRRIGGLSRGDRAGESSRRH